MQTDVIAGKEQDNLELDRPDDTPLRQTVYPKKARIAFVIALMMSTGRHKGEAAGSSLPRELGEMDGPHQID